MTFETATSATNSGHPRAITRAVLATLLTVAVASAAGVAGDARTAGKSPDGMAWVPAGEFRMGSDDPRFSDAKPVRRVWVDGFWADKTEVTNAQFARFIDATRYVTVAERVPRAEDFPGVPKDQLVAGSVCFAQPAAPVMLGRPDAWWRFVPGANWRHPEGPASNLDGRDWHPVVHVAFEDAEAFAAWAKKRLPTEAEWERAARGGLAEKPYVWGDVWQPDGRPMANTFQGHFPDHNTAEDGFAGAAPVAKFPANAFGLFDVSGNVWEWTSDWYHPRTFRADAARGEPSLNPAGPAREQSQDPAEPGVPKRVQKGGSFLCSDQYCVRYMPGGRGKGEPATSSNHVGFRCVQYAK